MLKSKYWKIEEIHFVTNLAPFLIKIRDGWILLEHASARPIYISEKLQYIFEFVL